MESPTTITIIHFNDVYNIESGTHEPVGGAARFMTAVRRLADRDPLVLFSGDALNPALMSTVTNGRQMVPVLNAIGVHCAVYGNHDFDHGVDNLVQVLFAGFVQRSEFCTHAICCQIGGSVALWLTAALVDTLDDFTFWISLSLSLNTERKA